MPRRLHPSSVTRAPDLAAAAKRSRDLGATALKIAERLEDDGTPPSVRAPLVDWVAAVRSAGRLDGAPPAAILGSPARLGALRRARGFLASAERAIGLLADPQRSDGEVKDTIGDVNALWCATYGHTPEFLAEQALLDAVEIAAAEVARGDPESESTSRALRFFGELWPEYTWRVDLSEPLRAAARDRASGRGWWKSYATLIDAAKLRTGKGRRAKPTSPAVVRVERTRWKRGALLQAGRLRRRGRNT